MTNKDVKNFRFMGYTLPPNVGIAIEELDTVVNVPDISFPAIRFGVPDELLIIYVDKELPEENEYVDLALALIKQPIEKEVE